MKAKMYLVTREFPYRGGEDSFVKPEYPYLCESFDVSIIAAGIDGNVQNEEQTNEIEACIIPTTQNLFDKLISFMCFLTEKDCYLEILSIIKEKKWILKRIYRALMFGTAAETFYRRLKKTTGLNKNTRAIFYFYWFDYKCFGLTMHKKKFPNIQIIARTHGYDLYDERELYGRQLFQRRMDTRLERLVFAAQYAKNYYLTRYNKHDCEKYALYRLGVSDKGCTGEQRRQGYEKDNVFLLISCSRAVDIKRIDCIIEGLSTIEDIELRWVHIGGGEQLASLRKLAEQKLGSNIQYEFTDTLSNNEVIQFYEENYVSCFITTTETEGGAPVSVQEALSFGVPIIATTVGELPQMIDNNGILLSENPDKNEVGDAIRQMAEVYGTQEYFEMCQASLATFEKKFDAKNNFTQFLKELVEL